MTAAPINVRSLAANLGFLAATEILCKIITLFAFAFLARILGPATFGGVEFAFATKDRKPIDDRSGTPLGHAS